MNIGITGARGRLGSALVEYYSACGHQVFAVSRNPDRRFNSLSDLHPALAVGTMDVLFHLAWSTVPRSSEISDRIDSKEDLELLKSLLDDMLRCQESGIGTPHFVFFSSCAVYGEAHHGETFNEASARSPVSDYGIAKVEAEDLIQEFAAASDVRTLILRLTNPYGFMKGDFTFQGVIPLMVKAAIASEEIHIWGNGLATKDFIHLSDVLSAIDALLNHDFTGVFNLCTGVATSTKALIAEVEEVTGKKTEVVYEEKKFWDIQHARYSNVRLREATGWNPRVNFKDGLKRLVEQMTSLPSKPDVT